MAVQDHSEGTGSNACVTTANRAASIDAHFGSERYITGNVHVPKARKPYTITKQREKWTDEEHQKFLEAVKLYGRGWRQIEEYVGTKTAVQIRSHAQKFFSKVARESNEGAEGSIKPIEIPPPRPKRKPMHPYPRKSVDTSRGTSVAAKADISTSPKLESGEKERQSPVSVFSALGSDTLDDQHGGCHSPASCTTNMLSSGLALTEKENECMTSKSPSQKQESFAFLQIFTTADQENPSLGESNLAAKSNGSTENDTIASSHPNIKLFGTRLVTEDSKETQTPGTESINLLPLKLGQEDLDTNDSGATKTLPSNEIDTQLSLGMSYSDLNVVPCASPLHCMENDRNACTTGADYCASLPWWALNQGVPLLNPVSHNSTSAQTPLRPRAVRIQECEIARDGSSTGSNSGSVSEVENERGLDVADSQTKHSRSEGKSNTLSYTRGFVPYKRCLAERDTTPSVNDVEERKGQRARVCL